MVNPVTMEKSVILDLLDILDQLDLVVDLVVADLLEMQVFEENQVRKRN